MSMNITDLQNYSTQLSKENLQNNFTHKIPCNDHDWVLILMRNGDTDLNLAECFYWYHEYLGVPIQQPGDIMKWRKLTPSEITAMELCVL